MSVRATPAGRRAHRFAGGGANKIPVANMLAHAVAGGLAAKALGNDVEAGAAAGLASAMAAQSGAFDGLNDTQVANVSKLLGVVAAVIAGGDAASVAQGANIANSAATNNYLLHSEGIRRAEALRRLTLCDQNPGSCSTERIATLNATVDQLNALDEQRDTALRTACADQGSSACATQMNEALSAILSPDDLTSFAIYGGYASDLQRASAAAQGLSLPNGYDTYFASLADEYLGTQALLEEYPEALTSAAVGQGAALIADGALTFTAGILEGRSIQLGGSATNKTFDFSTSGSGTNLTRTTSIDGTDIRINSGHAYNRTHSGGDVSQIGTMDEIETAILNDISSNSRLNGLTGTGNQHTIQLNGQTVIYELSDTPIGPVLSNYYPPNP